ncbi:MAG: hypothetical protein P4N41_14245 [Negativicutes bacterium]|nr:hypothetical protein [Negativicutes bacterium]
MKKLIILCLLVLSIAGPATCSAAASGDNALAAVALYIDTSGRYVPGADLLNKALNEVIRFKVNALFLGSEVQSGNEVLRDLNRCSVTGAAGATAENLAAYAANRHVNYIILLSVRPIDVALDIKTYSTADSAFLVDKSVTRPDGQEAQSTLDALSDMVGSEVTTILQTIRGS